MGLRSAETVKRLCAVQNLSLSHAIAVCRADEAAARDAVELRAGGLARAAAHRVDAAERHRAPPSAGPRRRDGGWCAACGRRRHRMGDACPARGQRCRSCRQLDHFAAVCPDASGDYDDRRPTTSYERRRLAPSRPRSSPPGRSYRPDPYRSSSRSPSPSLDTRRSQRRQPRRGTRVRFQSSEGSSDRSPDGAARRPAASAIIAVASVQSAPRVRLDVTAQRRASVLALPDTGADICVGGLDFLREMDEYPENLLPPEQHPRTANGETVKSLGVLPVSLNLGRVSVQESVHILEGVSGLLLSWKAVKGLHIIPAGYPQQITADLPEPASGSRTGDAPDRPRPGPARHRHRSRAALPDGGTSSDCVAAVSRDGAAGEATAATPVERPDSSLPTGAPASEDGSAEPPVDQGGSFPDITSEFPTVFDGHIRRASGGGAQQRRGTPPHQTVDCDDRRESRRCAAKRWYDQHAHDLPEFPVGTRVRVQDVRTKRWDRCGVVTSVGPHRRYSVRFDDGGEVDRNRCHLRRRHALCPVPGVEPPGRAGPCVVTLPDTGRMSRDHASASESRASTRPDRAPRTEPPTVRRSTRVRKPVRRLIEEM
ncbi:hypothetical protein FJT64_025020 [Amphibalanus amphitrite]|uniref:CCHC-type domain-containing protein n=1 Tax=Amphibalanus amphitrite TaxID=1232801 RepID=A0A6A4WJW7_AMPAM|nr:hypothetical protein FJT64_025020 [Amphibalanus amphitrite]